MNNKKLMLKLCPVALSVAMASQAQAGITLYEQDGTSFSADGHFNAFFTATDNEATGEKQQRVRMGFLPNYIGFNVSKQVGDLTVGGRSSFWVSINDGHTTPTNSGIDVRQFYATVDGDFGQVLFGKDFGLYARSNIFSDELLLGTGLPSLDSGIVTLGNISVGYPYAQPRAQITYRTKPMNGFQIAAGILDPSSGESADSNTNNSARVEAEVTYATDFEGGKFNAWVGGAAGENEASDVDASGLAYGARVAFGGFQLTASGYDQEGIDTTFAGKTLTSETESDGYLVQGSYSVDGHRFVLSHGQTDLNGSEKEMDSVAYFYDVNSNLKLIVEYDMVDSAGDETDQIAVGASLSW
ncbi:porin [Pontibacterium granulatum]|uniref:porin n=1 Tax=Pontibacterium granulatum TaxID=2036029 RepID=UPI00249B2652|nr:porin [Pontibacterium granulatum]MDI3326329.1 porin [Pontibacterium granulatum]